MLRDFLTLHRGEILTRARRGRTEPDDLPAFLDALCSALATGADPSVDPEAIARSASQHGEALFRRGTGVAQAVHDFGDLHQVVIGLAAERNETIPPGDRQTLSRCLDDAVADAVTAFSRLHERSQSAEATERLGVLAHELRNLLNTAIISFECINEGAVGTRGATSAVHQRALLGLQKLIDGSLTNVRLDAGTKRIERVAARDVIEEAEIGASLEAASRGLRFEASPVDATAAIDADRPILAAAIANLLQNAFKFTRPGTTVRLRTTATPAIVSFEVEDECGGLPHDPESLLRPFHQQGADRSGLGLGLSICVKAASSLGGALHVRDLPGKGCVFTIDLPRKPPPLVPLAQSG